MTTAINADVFQGQIDTASGLLRWVEAEADKTRRAITISPLLGILSCLLSSIIRKAEAGGVESFDPLHAGYASEKFREVCDGIRVLISRSQNAGFYTRFPCHRFLVRIERQGKHFGEIASALSVVDEQWQRTVSEAASKKIAMARTMAIEMSDQPIDLFDVPEDPSAYPPENAIRAQFHRAVNLR
jgi:hypothetical protein